MDSNRIILTITPALWTEPIKADSWPAFIEKLYDMLNYAAGSGDHELHVNVFVGPGEPEEDVFYVPQDLRSEPYEPD